MIYFVNYIISLDYASFVSSFPFCLLPFSPSFFFQAVTNVDDRSAMRWRKSLREGKTCERESMGD